MFLDFTNGEERKIFNIRTNDFDRLHDITEALMISYCRASDRTLEEFTRATYTEDYANRLIDSLFKNDIRVPTEWDNGDLSALFVLLTDINFHTEAMVLYDLLNADTKETAKEIEKKAIEEKLKSV